MKSKQHDQQEFFNLAQKKKEKKKLKLAFFLGFGLGFWLVMQPVAARDLQGRLGIGYNRQFANATATGGVPGVSLKYAFTKDLGIEAIAGVNTVSPTNSVAGAKFFKNVFFETSLNFYFFIGAALLNANSRTASEFLGGIGAEFFIPGVESLGFAVETGGSFTNVTGSFALRTMGVSFIDAGIHFYF